MTTRLTKKDIATTIGVLVAAFVGIPLVLWGISESRLAAFKNRADARVRPIIVQTIGTARVATKVFGDERVADVALSTRSHYFRWREYDRYGNESRVRYQASQTAREDACNKFTDAIKKIDFGGALNRYDYGDSEGCTFIIKTATGYAELETEYIRSFDDSVDSNYIQALTTSSDDLPISSHRDGRSMHFLVLVSKDPLVVWNLRVWSEDQ